MMSRRLTLVSLGIVVSGIAAVMLGSQPALAQQLGGARPLEIPYLQILAALVVCSLAALGAALAIQRRSGRALNLKFPVPWKSNQAPNNQPLKVLESHRLSPHADVCRISAHDSEYIVIVTAGSVTIVSERPVAIEATTPSSNPEDVT